MISNDIFKISRSSLFVEILSFYIIMFRESCYSYTKTMLSSFYDFLKIYFAKKPVCSFKRISLFLSNCLALVEKFYGTLSASLGICPLGYCPKLGGLNVIGGH